jgi:large subunit ribosomal protein L21
MSTVLPAPKFIIKMPASSYAGSFWRYNTVYAIVECGGRQYRAEEGHSFSVEKLAHEVGDQIELDNVLLLSNDNGVSVGTPAVAGVTVKATVVEQYRGQKIFVWKYKPKVNYRRRQGHRQYYTRLRVDEIIGG